MSLFDEKETRRNSDRLHVKASDSHGHRSLNQIDRENQALITVDGSEDSGDAIKTSSTNANLLTYIQKRMRHHRDAIFDQALHAANLIFGNRRSHTANAYESMNAVCAQY